MNWMLAMITVANAGIVREVCSKLVDKFVTDDPHQYEFVATAWIERQVAAYHIKANWKGLDKQERSLLRIMERELALRKEFAL